MLATQTWSWWVGVAFLHPGKAFSWKDWFIWEPFLPASGDPFHLRGLLCGLCPTLVQSQGGLGSTRSTLWDPGRGHGQAGSTPGLTNKYGRSLVFILPIVYVHRKCTEPFPESTEPLLSSEASCAPCYGPELSLGWKAQPKVSHEKTQDLFLCEDRLAHGFNSRVDRQFLATFLLFSNLTFHVQEEKFFWKNWQVLGWAEFDWGRFPSLWSLTSLFFKKIIH